MNQVQVILLRFVRMSAPTVYVSFLQLRWLKEARGKERITYPFMLRRQYVREPQGRGWTGLHGLERWQYEIGKMKNIVVSFKIVKSIPSPIHQEYIVAGTVVRL